MKIRVMNPSSAMEELLAGVPDYGKQPQFNTLVQGVFLFENREGAYVNINAKVEGLLPPAEVAKLKGQGINMSQMIGEKTPATFLIVRQPSDGDDKSKSTCYELSFIEAQPWAKAQDLMKRNAREMAILKQVKTASPDSYYVIGALATLHGLTGFIPPKMLATKNKQQLEALIGKPIPVLVEEAEPTAEKNRLILNHKAAVEQLRQECKPGNKMIGEVTSVVDYGAFFDVGGATGLLHITKLGTRVSAPGHFVHPGMKAELVVLDRPDGKLSFGLAEGSKLPLNAEGIAAWEAVENLHTTRETVEVEVVQVLKAHNHNAAENRKPLVYHTGVVAMLDGMRGFIPASHLQSRGDQLEDLKGKKVKVVVFEADRANDKLVLSQTKANELNSAKFIDALKQKMAAEGRVTLEGEVMLTFDYGVFVRLADGVDGLAHVSDLPKNIESPHSLKGRIVKVAVQRVRDDNKISLSMPELPA